jgi:hypothetical protein
MTTLASTASPTAESGAFARRPVLAVAALVAVVVGAASGRGSFFFDELYFLMAGREHLAWGYFDQPPLVPALAAGLDALAPGSLLVFRLPVTLGAAAMVVLAAAIVRELGGGRGPQVLAAVAVAVSAVPIGSHWLATYTLDPLWWTVIIWLVARWVRVRDDRLLLVAGAVTGLSLNTKFLVPALWVGILAAVALCGPRQLLGRPALWIAGLIAVAMTVPTLLWQAANGWPYLQMNDVVRAEFDGPLGFASGAALSFGLLGLALAVIGLVRAVRLRHPAAWLAVTSALVIAAMVGLHGRSYYVLSLVPALVALGAVELDRWARGRARIVRTVLGSVAGVLSALIVLTSLPLLPQAVLDGVPGLPVHALQTGEQVLDPAAEAGAAAWAQVPAADQAHTAVMAQIYPLAAAVESRGLPTWSPHRGYGYFAPPPATATDVLWLGFDPPPAELVDHFASCAQQPGDGLQVWRCTGRRGAWAQWWPDLRTR